MSDFPQNFFNENLNLDTMPVAFQIFRQIENSKLDKAEHTYINSKKSGSLYMTEEELKITRSKRTNKKNREKYGKNWFSKQHKERRVKKFLQQNCICPDCKEKHRIDNMTLDHIIPIRDGGTNEGSNLEMVCKECHHKRDFDPALL